jgi:hypothetical protein
MTSGSRAAPVSAVLLLIVAACSDDVGKKDSKSTLYGPDGHPLASCPKVVGDTFDRLPFRQSKPFFARACNPNQAQAIVACFIVADQSTASQCEQFVKDQANNACLTCAISAPNDPVLGPILFDPQTTSAALNFPGCIAGVTNDPSPTGCSSLYSNASSCVFASCDCASQTFRADCIAAAQQTTCSKYYSAAKCAQGAIPICEGTGATYWLNPQGGFENRAFELIKFFCGDASSVTPPTPTK